MAVLLPRTLTRRTLATTIALLGVASAPQPGFHQAHAQTATDVLDVETGPWPAATPEDAGIDPALPDTLDAVIAEYPAVTGIVVIRGGAIVTEHYQGDYGRDDLFDIRSVTKSVIGTLVGIALQRNELPSIDAAIGELIPDRIADGADPGVAGITVRGLLTMTSGLEWDYRSDYERLEASADPVLTTLGQPITAAEGEVYVYNSGGSHLLGLIVAEVAGQPL
ncbi:MAG: serine hydrolase, partial [Chloroflexia bacterium]|nr:serine hydrolase [Chloroflexia bacterium]